MIHLVRLKMDKFLIGVVNECVMSNWWSWKNSHRSIGEARGWITLNKHVLQLWWASCSAVGRETKKSQNDYFFGEAFRFDVWVRLKDQYKNEFGQWIDHFIWGAFNIYAPLILWLDISSKMTQPCLFLLVFVEHMISMVLAMTFLGELLLMTTMMHIYSLSLSYPRW